MGLCFFGAGGQIWISGILNLSAFGVLQCSKSELEACSSMAAMAEELEAAASSISSLILLLIMILLLLLLLPPLLVLFLSFFFVFFNGGVGFVPLLVLPPLEAMDLQSFWDFLLCFFSKCFLFVRFVKNRRLWRNPFEEIERFWWEERRHWRTLVWAWVAGFEVYGDGEEEEEERVYKWRDLLYSEGRENRAHLCFMSYFQMCYHTFFFFFFFFNN